MKVVAIKLGITLLPLIIGVLFLRAIWPSDYTVQQQQIWVPENGVRDIEWTSQVEDRRSGLIIRTGFTPPIPFSEAQIAKAEVGWGTDIKQVSLKEFKEMEHSQVVYGFLPPSYYRGFGYDDVDDNEHFLYYWAESSENEDGIWAKVELSGSGFGEQLTGDQDIQGDTLFFSTEKDWDYGRSYVGTPFQFVSTTIGVMVIITLIVALACFVEPPPERTQDETAAEPETASS